MNKTIATLSACFFITLMLTAFGDFEHINTRTANPASTSVASPDLETIRKRIIADLLEPQVNAPRISELVKSLRPDGSWPGINYKDVSRTGFEHRIHLENMVELSRAYKKPGSPFYMNADVRKTVSSALDYWIAHDFICENWWWNEMGTPNLMINTLLLMDTDLTEKQRKEGARIANRANLEASGARPGGDLIQIAGMLGKQGLFARDEQVLQRVVKVMADEIKITTGRGMKPDMSFHHRVDNVISTLTYGTGYANTFSYWAVKIAGTKFKLPEQSMNLLIDYYLDGICKSLVYATYHDPGAMNRDLSRQGALDAFNASTAENLLKASSYRRAELMEVVKVRKGEKKPGFTWNRFFWHSSYFTHQRPSWFASVRMHSSRGSNMEQPHNEEGLKNHHFADGSTFISLTGKEYFDIFPVWDWQKIPGATIMQKPALPHWREIPKKGLTDFSGGVSDGNYGVAGFDFASVHDPLKARKSWFFFDKEYVCLGAGISATSGNNVFTTINQCLLNKDVTVSRNNNTGQADTGITKLNGVSWVHHDGLGYLFHAPADLWLQNSTATGNWRQINHQSWATEEPVSKKVFSIWIDHGPQPQSASYQYTVIPSVTPSAAEAYKKRGDVQVISNTPALQAVSHKGLQRTEAVFYEPGKIILNSNVTLVARQPCIVMVKMEGKNIREIAVSDPTHKLKQLELQVDATLAGSGSDWKIKKENNSSILEVTLPQEGYAGKTVIVKLK
jgi:chondroitin AC lyase